MDLPSRRFGHTRLDVGAGSAGSPSPWRRHLIARATVARHRAAGLVRLPQVVVYVRGPAVLDVWGWSDPRVQMSKTSTAPSSTLSTTYRFRAVTATPSGEVPARMKLAN